MKNNSRLLLLIFSFILTACKECPLKLGFPEKVPNPTTSANPPSVGCNQDVSTNFKNNCNIELLVYFIEVIPGSTFNCTSFSNFGRLGPNQSRKFTIHKGKIAQFVFAIDPEGQCTRGHRKSEFWVDCSKSNGNEGFFSTCP